MASGQIHRDDNKKQRKKKNMCKLEAAEHTTKNILFKDVGELHFYNLLDMGIGANGVPSLNLNFFSFWQLIL